MKLKNRILENPTTTVVIAVSVLCFIIGAMALNPLISFIVVAIIDILYFKDKILELISSSKKKSSGNKKKDTKKKNEKKVKQPDKAIYEYKVGDEIVSTGDGKMKKKTNQKETKPQKEKNPK